MPGKVGIIGVGKVGSRIAANLQRANFEVLAHDPSDGAKKTISDLGLRSMETPAAVAAEVEWAVLSLPNPAVERAVVTGPGGIVEGGRPGLLVMDTSTLSPETCRELASACAIRDITFLDTPITGGLIGAEAGTLNVFIGGPAEAVDRVEPVLSAIAETWHYMGPSGAAQAAKLIHNQIGQTLVVLFTEAMLLGAAQGLSPEDVYQTLRNHTRVYDFGLDKFRDRTLSGDREAKFTLDMAHKDLTEMVALAHNGGLYLPLTSLVREVHQIGRAMGRGGLDNTTILDVYRQICATDPLTASLDPVPG